MIDRRRRGLSSAAFAWSSPKPPSRPVLRQPQTIDLARHLNLARADYREGDIAAAERAVTALAADIDRALHATGSPDPMLRALAGSMFTLTGLIGLVSGDNDRARATFHDAVVAFEPVRRLVERQGDLVADYGIALAHSGAPERAAPALERAISLGEDTPDVRRAYATVLCGKGTPERAVEQLRTLVARAPYDWQAHRALAELAERLGSDREEVAHAWLATARVLLAATRFDEAIAAFTRAERLAGPLDVDDELRYAEVLVAANRTDDALGHLRAAAGTGTPAQLVAAAELFARLGEFGPAGDLVDAALTAEPDFRDALLLRARLFLAADRPDQTRSIVEKLIESDPADVRGHVLHGIAALQADDAATAVAALTHADSLNPGQPDVLANLGAALAERGDLKQASAILDRAVDLAPRDAWVLELRGRVRFDLGRTADAEADLRAALELEPVPEARALLGEALRLRGAHDEALATLDLALAQDPGIGWAWASRGEILIATGESSAARDSFENALRQDRQHLPALVGLANALLDADGPDSLPEAESVVAEALALDPESAEAHALLGEIRRRHGRLRDALASLNRAVEISVDYAYALATRGEVLLGLYSEGDQKALDRAVRTLRKAARSAPDNRRTVALLGLALLLAGKDRDALEIFDRALDGLDRADGELDEASRAELANLLTQRGQARLGVGRPADAAADLRRGIELGDDRPEVRALLAEASYLAGAHPEALAQAEFVLTDEPEHEVALAVRGAAKVTLDDPAGGIADLRRVVEREPGNLFAIRQLRQALAAAGRQDEAVDVVGTAVAHQPANVELLREYAETAVAAADHQLTLDVLDRLVAHTPKDRDVLRLLGTTLAALGRHDEAVSALEQLVNLSADDTGAVIVLANEYARAGRFDTALSTLDAIPVDPHVLTARANILADVGRWAEAVDAAEAAVALDPGDRFAHSVLGWALQHGDAVDALRSMRAYEEAVRLDPEDLWARKGLANALYLLDSRDEAREHYKRVAARLAGISARDPYHNALRGWCLYRLRRYLPAVDCLQRAVDEPDLRAGVLFDLMLAQLGVGDDLQAGDSLTTVRAELRRLPPDRRRGLTSVALDNLRTATARELADRPAAETLLKALLTEESTGS